MEFACINAKMVVYIEEKTKYGRSSPVIRSFVVAGARGAVREGGTK
jgi:hypothetical protein